MKISANDLIDLLAGLVSGDAECEAIIEKAYKKEITLWEQGEWIYIKDIEMCLKGIKKASPDIFSNIENHIFHTPPPATSAQEKWVAARIEEIKTDLNALTQS